MTVLVVSAVALVVAPREAELPASTEPRAELRLDADGTVEVWGRPAGSSGAVEQRYVGRQTAFGSPVSLSHPDVALWREVRETLWELLDHRSLEPYVDAGEGLLLTPVQLRVAGDLSCRALLRGLGAFGHPRSPIRNVELLVDDLPPVRLALPRGMSVGSVLPCLHRDIHLRPGSAGAEVYEVVVGSLFRAPYFHAEVEEGPDGREEPRPLASAATYRSFPFPLGGAVEGRAEQVKTLKAIAELVGADDETLVGERAILSLRVSETDANSVRALELCAVMSALVPLGEPARFWEWSLILERAD